MISPLILSALVVLVYLAGIEAKSKKVKESHNKSPNILLILADDLGYGDLSVKPFVGFPGIKTPNLQRMADRGTVLANYHTAAATCTPTRASILTGMYPWRMGIKAVYEYGERGRSNRDDWLPPLPTIPMVLSEANYSVFHSGKWHLGGMRLDDLTMRTLPDNKGKRCPHPGPNQQGFKNYASVLDGPGSPRQNHLQYNGKLYSEGCQHMLYNDVPVGNTDHRGVNGYLSSCEAQHAMRAMNMSVQKNKPFYIQTWFHCPHGPLEEVPGWRHLLPERSRTKGALNYEEAYVTMIADMDVQIGRMLQNLKDLGIEQDTLVIFTSDNGPEHFAGRTAGFKGSKRFLYEGGIRVPTIVQWPGTIPSKERSDAFVVSTDLFPTFLDVAGVKIPPQLRLDGISVLPQLIPDYYDPAKGFVKSTSGTSGSGGSSNNNVDVSSTTPVLHPGTGKIRPNGKMTKEVINVKDNQELYKMAVRDRITLWHNDYEGPRRTLGWVYDYKVFLDENEMMYEMYDMVNDQFESKNLLLNHPAAYWAQFQFNNASGQHVLINMPAPPATATARPVTLDRLLNDRRSTEVHLWIASHMFRVLKDFATYGNSAYVSLMQANPGWYYLPTLDSDYRIPGKRFKTPQQSKTDLVAKDTCGTAPCGCAVKSITGTPTLPFSQLADGPTRYIYPGKVLNGTKILKVKH